MTDGGTRPTAKFDPQELLGLLALTAAKERLRPTCEMPKIELTNLLQNPAMGRATAAPIVEPQPLAKGSSGITAIPREVLVAAQAADEAADEAAATEAVSSLLEKTSQPEPVPFAKFLSTERADSGRRFLLTLASCAAATAAALGLLSLV